MSSAVVLGVSVLSAVTKNYLQAHRLAIARLELEISAQGNTLTSLRGPAACGGSVFSDTQDIAARYLRDDLRNVIRSITKSIQEHNKRIEVLCRSVCPACLRGQRQHCSSCGACSREGPSCMDLQCESVSAVL